MNKTVKQRLVGALLLLLVAAILVPLTLRTPDQVRVALDLEVPPAPESTQMVLEPVITSGQQQAVTEQIEHDRATLAAAGERYNEQAGQDEPPSVVATPAPEPAPAPTPAPAPAPEPKPAPAPEPALSGWAVQIGSFSQPDRAASEAQRLRDQGYRAFTRAAVSGDGKPLHRVYAGPDVQRADAIALRDRLAADTRLGANGVSGLVVSLAP
ncbi:SPOR domain-containing protein [Isoalcanivorax beigongshangi]|uniref:SPOR domain-containing protein n=1 Tax=Isoalcanivorax beigongshangi TaxID=3238810 RepID=A0ABV4AG55_9GAMM